MPQHRETARLLKACGYCRSKKVKCDGALPCGNCTDRGHECSYPPRNRRRRKPRRYDASSTNIVNDDVTASRGEIWVLEGGGDASQTCVQDPMTVNRLATSEELHPNLNPPQLSRPICSQSITAMPTEETANIVSRSVHGPSGPFSESDLRDVPGDGGPAALTPEDSDTDREEATINLTDINWEHHGPGSWLSVCSAPGIQWVCDRVGDNDFAETAQGLIKDWTKHLTLSQYPTAERSPELDFDTALQYSKCYFEYAQGTAFGVVNRDDFQEHIHRHFQRATTDDGDAASYALRNAVYAVGCRMMCVHGCQDFSQTQEQALKLFFNAFSRFPDLLFMPSGLRAVQSLVVMTSFAELLGSPSIEYMLCGAAARLALSKGLHRQPAAAWHLPESEKIHRSCIFWAIYCHDKYLALRCGRPSTLQDDEISCQVPTVVPLGSTLDLNLLAASMKHAQICDAILKSLYSVKSLQKSPEDLSREVKDLQQRLEDWQSSFTGNLADMQVGSLEYMRESDKNQTDSSRLLRVYNGSIIALHAVFHYPWMRPRHQKQDETASTSSAQTAAAARRILTSLRDYVPDCASSSPNAFCYPMLAIISLFVYILKYPTLSTTQSDIALLDIGAGHFGQIHHLTSGHVSFQFPREVSVLANKAAKRAAARTKKDTGSRTIFNPSGNFSSDLSEMPLLNATLSPDHWSAFSADFLNEFPIEGDLIMM